MVPTEYVTKDSGERKTFDSGMVRDTNDGKMLWHLIAAGPMLRRWAALLTRGARKYSANNWMKAKGQEELDRFRESAFRHFMQWFNGEEDEDHAAAVMFNINGAEYVKDGNAKPASDSCRQSGVRSFRFVPDGPNSNHRWYLFPGGSVYYRNECKGFSRSTVPEADLLDSGHFVEVGA